MAEGKDLGRMLPAEIESLNIEYWSDDCQQMFDISWILKVRSVIEVIK